MQLCDLSETIDLGDQAALITYLNLQPVCPKCQQRLSDRVFDRWRYGRRVLCSGCGVQITWRSGTPFDGSRHSSTKLRRIVEGRADKADPVKVAQNCGIDVRSVKDWWSRLDVYEALTGIAGA